MNTSNIQAIILENNSTGKYFCFYKLLCPKTSFILETHIEKVS